MNMDIEIEGRHKNILLHREEINFEVINEKKTPSRAEVRAALAGKLGTDENLVIIDEIDHEFGSTRIVGFAKKYDSIEELKKTEAVHMRVRNGEKKEEAANAGSEGK